MLSLLEHLTIDFPFHFILFIIDVHLNSAFRDKLIFPSVIRHFSVPFPSSDHFTVICAIDYTTVKCNETQFRSWQLDSATPPSYSAPSHSASSSSAPPSSSGNVTLKDIMVQLQCMDAHLDTFSTELYQVNVCVDRIAQPQASMGGFALKATPSPPSHVASDSEDGDDDDDADGDASFSDEMSA